MLKTNDLAIGKYFRWRCLWTQLSSTNAAKFSPYFGQETRTAYRSSTGFPVLFTQ